MEFYIRQVNKTVKLLNNKMTLDDKWQWKLLWNIKFNEPSCIVTFFLIFATVLFSWCPFLRFPLILCNYIFFFNFKWGPCGSFKILSFFPSHCCDSGGSPTRFFYELRQGRLLQIKLIYPRKNWSTWNLGGRKDRQD